MNSKSKIIIPFLIHVKNEKLINKNSDYFNPENIIGRGLSNWEENQPKVEYMTSFLRHLMGADGAKQVENDNSICSYYELANENIISKNQKVTFFSKLFPDETFFFTLEKIELIYFKTGLGLIVINVIHEDEEGLDVISKKCQSLAFMMSADGNMLVNNENLVFKYQETGEILDFQKIIFDSIAYDSIMQSKGNEMDWIWYPSNAKHKANAYHVIVRDGAAENDEQYLYCLARGIRYTGNITDEALNNNPERFFSPSDYSKFCISANGVAAMAYRLNNNEKKILSKYSYNNLINEYYMFYLLALHERAILMHYAFLVVNNWNQVKRLANLRSQLVNFTMLFSYTVVSEEENYQIYYERISKELRLEKFEEDIINVIETVDDYESAKRERGINGLLACIGFLAVFSALVDLSDFLSNYVTHTSNELTLGHGIGIGCILIAVIIGIWLYFKSKK